MKKYTTLGGWLLWSVIMSFVGMAAYCASFVNIVESLESLKSPLLDNGMREALTLFIVGNAISIASFPFAVLFLAHVFKRKSMFLFYWQIRGIMSLVGSLVGGIFPALIVDGIEANYGGIIGSALALILWTRYFCVSVRVRTYMGTDEYLDKAVFCYGAVRSGAASKRSGVKVGVLSSIALVIVVVLIPAMISLQASDNTTASPNLKSALEAWTVETVENADGGYSFSYAPDFGQLTVDGTSTTITNLSDGSDISISKNEIIVDLDQFTQEQHEINLEEAGFTVLGYDRFERMNQNGYSVLRISCRLIYQEQKAVVEQKYIVTSECAYLIACGDTTENRQYSELKFSGDRTYFEYVMDSFVFE